MPESLKLGIIGHPVHHTLSPALHAHVMQALGITGEYKVYDIVPDALQCSLQDFQEAGLTGLNVTIPHKVAVMPLLDSLSSDAQLCGAVNTLVFDAENQTLHGHNTDVAGFLQSLPDDFADTLAQRQILVLGAGGSARVVLMGLIRLQAAAITLAVRNVEKGVALLEDVERMKEHAGSATAVSVVSLDSLPSLEAFGGIVNTTPVGMWPDASFSPFPKTHLQTLAAGALVYDLIYRPLETQLLKDAAALGYATQNGLRMLVHQGLAAFERWTDQTLPQGLAAETEEKLAAILAQETARH